MISFIIPFILIYAGLSLKTPCETRWNSLYDSLQSFLKNYKTLENANVVMSGLNLPAFTKNNIDLLAEYSAILEPVAIVLDIFQGDRQCFMGLGIVLPQLTKIKKKLSSKHFPNLNAIRDRILENRFQVQYLITWLNIEILNYFSF